MERSVGDRSHQRMSEMSPQRKFDLGMLAGAIFTLKELGEPLILPIFREIIEISTLE